MRATTYPTTITNTMIANPTTTPLTAPA
jgi:hypothetical protein